MRHLAPARVLLRHQPNLGGKIPSRSESLRISDAGDQSGGERGTNAGNRIEPPARLIGSVPGHDPATIRNWKFAAATSLAAVAKQTVGRRYRRRRRRGCWRSWEEHIGFISNETRKVVEELWPELAH